MTCSDTVITPKVSQVELSKPLVTSLALFVLFCQKLKEVIHASVSFQLTPMTQNYAFFVFVIVLLSNISLSFFFSTALVVTWCFLLFECQVEIRQVRTEEMRLENKNSTTLHRRAIVQLQVKSKPVAAREQRASYHIDSE